MDLCTHARHGHFVLYVYIPLFYVFCQSCARVSLYFGHCYIGVVGFSEMAAKPLLLPEPFDGTEATGWSEWLDHFESVAAVNKWVSGEDRLKWLRVRLTGKAQTAFRRLPDDVKTDYGKCLEALQRRFNPDSKRQLYMVELNARTKRRDEDWAAFGDAVRILADKAYPELAENARERLALNQFLDQIENPQVAFSVKQKRPRNVEEAAAAVIELESYLGTTGKPSRVSVVSPQEQEPDTVPAAERVSTVTSQDGGDSLIATMKSLCDRLQRVEVLVGEKEQRRGGRGASKPSRENDDGKRKEIVCWSCGKKGHVARFCSRGQNSGQHQGNFRPSVVRAFHMGEEEEF